MIVPKYHGGSHAEFLETRGLCRISAPVSLMAGLVVDTHALVWYVMGSLRLSATARSRLDAALAAGDPTGIASLTCLTESWRRSPTDTALIATASSVGMEIGHTPKSCGPFGIPATSPWTGADDGGSVAAAGDVG